MSKKFHIKKGDLVQVNAEKTEESREKYLK